MPVRPPNPLIVDPAPSRPTPEPDSLFDSAQVALADTPWWGWALLALAALVTVVLAVWLVWFVVSRTLRALVQGVRGLSARVADTAITDRTELAARARAWGDMAVGWLLVGQFLTAMGFAAWVMGSTARDELGIPEPANWLLFVVFEGFALVIMALIKQRAEEGMPAPGLLLGYWATIGLASMVVSTHGDDLVQRIVFACITLFAGATYALRMHAKRKVQEEELLKAGKRWASRRIALVRLLHPLEFIKVTFDMASDENLTADEATQRVRVRGARDAIWTLGRAKQEPMATTTWGARRQIRHEQRLERRAQRAIARAGMSGNSTVVAVLEGELRMMSMATTLATTDHALEEQPPVEELDVAVEDAAVDSEEEPGFGAAWFGELEPARLDPQGRIDPDPVVEEFVARPDPWQDPGPIRTVPEVEPDRTCEEASDPGPDRPDPVERTGPEPERADPIPDPGPIRVEESAGSDRIEPVAESTVETEPDRTGQVESDRSEPGPEPDRVEPDRVEPTADIGSDRPDTGERINPTQDRTEPALEPDRTAKVEAGTEPAGSNRIEPAAESDRSGGGLRPGMTVETGSGRLRVKALKPRPGPEPDRSIRAVGGRTGPYRTFDELQADMEQAIRTGQIADNVVDHLVRELKIGKVRARKLRDWARETRLFERIREEQHETSSAGGTLEEPAPNLPSTPGVRP